MDVYSYENLTNTTLSIGGYTILPYGEVVSNGSTIAVLDTENGGRIQKYLNGVLVSATGSSNGIPAAWADAERTALVGAGGIQVPVSGAGIGPVAVSGTPSAGQVPTATSSTTATWQNQSGGGSVSPLSALQAKLASIASGSAALASVLTIGDSVSGDVSLPLLRPMVRAFGNAGLSNGGEQVGWTTTLAGGAAVTASSDFSKWIGGKWTDIPNAGSLTYFPNNNHASDYPLPSGSLFRVGYLTAVGGGTFVVEQTVNSGGAWSTLGTIDTNAAAGYSAQEYATGLTSVSTATRWRLRSTSGTCAVVSVLVGSNSGYRSKAEIGIGGTSLADYITTSSAIWNSYLSECAPDLVFVYFKDDVNSAYTTALATLAGYLETNCPRAQVIWIGGTEDSSGTAANLPSKAAAQAAAALMTNGNGIYWDASVVWGTYTNGNALGMYTDVVHPNGAGRAALAARFIEDFGLFATSEQGVPWKLTGPALDFAGALLKSGGTVTGQIASTNVTDVPATTTPVGSSTAAVAVAGGLHVGKNLRADLGVQGYTVSPTAAAVYGEARPVNGNATSGSYSVRSDGNNTSGSYNLVALSASYFAGMTGAANNTSQYCCAIRGEVKATGGATGTNSHAAAFVGSFESANAVGFTNAYGAHVQMTAYGSATIGTTYGFKATLSKGGTAAFTTSYGVHLDAGWGTTAATSWAFYNDSVAPSLSKGAWTWRPAASATPAANGDLTFEATSNTSLTVKFKGSDGTVRSAVLTLA